MKKNKWLAVFGLAALMMVCAGCGSSGSVSYDKGSGSDNAAMATESAAAEEYIGEYSMSQADAAAPAEAGAEILEENTQATERKLIKTVDIYAETENYDELLVGLEKQITELGGYIEYEFQYNGSNYSGYDELRNSRLEIRIPAARLDEFIVKVGEVSNITNKEERVEDVTLQYVDLESRKKALTTQQERLLELLEQAETVEDIIAIEQKLSDVRYELESMESQLCTLNNQIDYSTINLNIEEVRRLTPTQEKSVWDKIKNGFGNTIYRIGEDIEDGFIWFVVNIPYFVLWIVIIAVVLLFGRGIVKRKRNKKQKKTEEDSGNHGTEL